MRTLVQIKPSLLCFPALCLTILNVPGAPVTFKSSEERVALIELYTSEGCSSCPPAEAWLSKQKESAGLWKDFVPLAFHVDYWDYLGWRDPWSGAQFSERQRSYAASWHGDTIYTPEFVLNGREWRAGVTGRTIPTRAETKVGVLMVKSTGINHHWQASFAPAQQPATGCDVHAALLGCELSSNVKAGENRGRQLAHDFVVLKLVKVAMILRDGAWHGEFDLLPPPGATKGRLALAVWVSSSGKLEPLQATGGWLDQPGGAKESARAEAKP